MNPLSLNTPPYVAIQGVSMYVPEDRLTNKDLEQLVETTDEWIVKRTGIKSRRILRDKPATHIAIQAAKDLLEKTNTDPKSIDLIIGGTNTPDHVFPAASCMLADAIKATNACTFDIQAGCPAFLYALSVGAQFIKMGTSRKALILGFDKISSIIDYTDRSTCILFGDGGGAALLGLDESHGIHCIDQGNEPSTLSLYMPAGGSQMPASHETVRDKQHFLKQDGGVVYRKACLSMVNSTRRVMEACNLTLEDIDWYAPHQANLRIINTVSKDLGIDYNKVLVNVEKYGNTSAGTIPILLGENEKHFKKGDSIILSSFGAGFTWASLYLTWAYNS